MSDDQENSGATSRTPSHIAYQVNKGREGQSYFNRIGAAFAHKDGAGIDVILSSTPVDGRITLRKAEDRLAGMKNGKSAEKDVEQER